MLEELGGDRIWSVPNFRAQRGVKKSEERNVL